MLISGVEPGTPCFLGPGNHHHHPSLNSSNCLAQASQNEKAWAVVPSCPQCGLGTKHTVEFAGLWKYFFHR